MRTVRSYSMPMAAGVVVTIVLLTAAAVRHAQAQDSPPASSAATPTTTAPAGQNPAAQPPPNSPQAQLRADLQSAFENLNAGRNYANPAVQGRNNLLQAERLFRSVRRDYPGLFQATLGLAESLRLLGRGQEAIDLYDELLRSNEADALFPANKGLGLIYVQNKWYAQAQPKLLDAYKLKSNDKEVLQAIAQCYQARDKLDDAMEYARYALSADPGDPELHLQLASLQMAKNDYIGAEGSAQRALRIRFDDFEKDQSDPQKIRLILQYSQFWLSVLQQYLQYKDNNPDYGTDTVELILRRIDLSRRVALMTQLLSLHDTLQWTEAMNQRYPDKIPLMLEMARLQAQLQMPERAEETCKKVLELAPGQAQATQFLAEIAKRREESTNRRGGTPEGLAPENPGSPPGPPASQPADTDAATSDATETAAP